MQSINVLILATYELAMSLLFSMVSIVLATHAMNRFVLSLPVQQFIRLKHKSGCLISGALIFSLVFLSRGSIEQSTMALQALINSTGGISFKSLAIALIYFLIFYVLSFGLSFLVIFLVSKIYRFIMKEIDFDFEIEKQDNFALSIFLCSILISIVLFMDKPISHILGSLVFYDSLLKF